MEMRCMWQCKQCDGLVVCETTREFALHLRTHLKGYRARKNRNEKAKNVQKKEKKTSPFQTDAPIVKFDAMSTSQLEISHPNSVFNLMNANFESREMCKQLVDPSLVMPSKRDRDETSEFNYTDLLNLKSPTENNDIDIIGENLNTPSNTTNNKLHILTKDLHLESPIKDDSLSLDVDINNKQCATITPLNLFCIDEQNYVSSVTTTNNIQSKFASQTNVVLVDNSIDETVKSMNFSRQIFTGSPIQIVPFNGHDSPPTIEVYQCEICGKQCETAFYLHRHLQIHIGDFTCQYCDRTFVRNDTLKAHRCSAELIAEKLKKYSIIVNHNEVNNGAIRIPDTSSIPQELCVKQKKTLPSKKIYRCEICDVTIRDKSGLNKHMFTHSEVRYTCVYCDTTVKHRQSMRRHLKQSHKEYEHEWDNADFISVLQIDSKSKCNKSKGSNGKKKKRQKKLKQEIPAMSPKRDRLIGTLSDELKLKFETNSLSRTKGGQISDYLNCETSVNSLKDDSSDLLSFTKHFDYDIAHTSFQALTLPDVTSRSFTGSEILKIDSKDSIKNFNVSPVMLLNKTRKSCDSLMDISPEKSSSTDMDKIQKFFTTPTKDKCVFFETPVKNWTENKAMPSMPILFYEEEAVETVEKEKTNVEIVVCRPVPEVKPSPIKTPQELLSSMTHHEEPAPSCSAGYVLEESAKSSMELMDTSTDFTFFVLS